MTKALKIHAYSMLILNGLIFVASLVSIGLGFYHLYLFGDGFHNILSIIYAFFHMIITFMGFMLIIKMIKEKKSMVMRTLMYTADDKDKKSKVAKILCIVFISVFSAIMIYMSLVLALHTDALFGNAFPIFLKLDLLNASMYVVFLSIYFLIFPSLFEKLGENERYEQQIT